MSFYTGKGINAQRQLLAGETNHDQVINDVLTRSVPKFLFKAVVVDVIFDPPNMTKELVEKYTNVLNESLLATAPRNSILAIIVSNAAAKRNERPAIFYPFFSHMHQPLKPGEKVWVVFEDENSHELGYWFSRIVERRDVDDPNFTHGDRIFIDQLTHSTIDRADPGPTQDPGPMFPNGSDTTEGNTLDRADAFETIEKEAIANRISTREPVPRYSKRPNDWAAEGSNNSLLVLGDDRTGPASRVVADRIVGRPTQDRSTGTAGMFDLVVGRGIGRDRKLPDPGVTPVLTAPAVIKNARGLLETDKDITNESHSEGDIDFEFDASYVYGTMDTDVDGNFGKPLPKVPGGASPLSVNEGAAVVVKSNHIRVVAREDGTVRIIKEGTLDDESGKGHACIIIENDGTIVIDGPHIIIGSGIEKGNGEGAQVFLGLDATEPIVLGHILRDLLNDYTTGIKQNVTDFCTQLTKFLTPLAATVGNLGLPIPGLSTPGAPEALVFNVNGPTKLVTDIAKTTQDFQGKVGTILSKIGKTR